MKILDNISNQSIWVTLIVGITVSIQGYFLHQTNSQPKKRNLIILTKSPVRLISRWDTVFHPNTIKEDKAGETATLVLNSLLTNIREEEFMQYKFNENIYIRVNTADIKSDEAQVNLNEQSNIKGL